MIIGGLLIGGTKPNDSRRRRLCQIVMRTVNTPRRSAVLRHSRRGGVNRVALSGRGSVRSLGWLWYGG